MNYENKKKFEVHGPIDIPSRIAKDVFKLYLFKFHSGNRYYVLEKGKIQGKSNVLTRINSKCIFADIFGSARCDCREQLHKAMKLISKNGEGLIIYAYDQDGRGISLEDHVGVYELQDKGFDTVEANLKLGLKPDQRDYSEIAEILHSLEIKSIKLLTNNPSRIRELEKKGIKVKRIPLEAATLDEHNIAQLAVKKIKLGHQFSFDIDKFWMKKAIDLAKKGIKTVNGGPLVGCIIVKNYGIKVGEGYYQRNGGPHAETLALKQAGKRAKNAIMYVTLEPCAHYGRTPPCIKAIITSRVKRIVISTKDPHPLVNGKGIKELKEAGLDVEVGLLERESEDLNKNWIKKVKDHV